MKAMGNIQGQGQGAMSEKSIVDDCLSTQKFLSNTQNVYAGESSAGELRTDILNVLQDEHQIQARLFQAASQRGWYAPKAAQDQDVSQAQAKFRNMPS
jgi:spore coat protein CotF